MIWWYLAADEYAAKVYCRPKKTITSQRGKRMVTPASIQQVLQPGASCCKSGNCISLWKDALGDSAEAVVTTERKAYAAMTETDRRTHFMTMLKTHKEAVIEVSAEKGPVLKGETRHLGRSQILRRSYLAAYI